MAATMKLSLTLGLLLLAGLVVFGDAKEKEGTCSFMCKHEGHITCENHPGEKIKGCNCECAPEGGRGCVVHLRTGKTKKCSEE